MDTVDSCWRSGAVGDLDRDLRTLKHLSSSACSLFFMSMLSRIYSTSTSRTVLRKAFQSACPVPTFSLKMVGSSCDLLLLPEILCLQLPACNFIFILIVRFLDLFLPRPSDHEHFLYVAPGSFVLVNEVREPLVRHAVGL